MTLLARRSFLTLLAAPAIVRTASLMPVAVILPRPTGEFDGVVYVTEYLQTDYGPGFRILNPRDYIVKKINLFEDLGAPHCYAVKMRNPLPNTSCLSVSARDGAIGWIEPWVRPA